MPSPRPTSGVRGDFPRMRNAPIPVIARRRLSPHNSSSDHTGGEQQMKLRSVWCPLIAALCCATAARAVQVDYFCPKFGGVLRFSDNSVTKYFGVEFPSKDRPPSTLVSASQSSLRTCSIAPDVVCLEDTAVSADGKAQTFVYAVPRVITGSRSYGSGDWEFTVMPDHHTVWTRSAAVIVARRIAAGAPPLQYKMYVEDGAGVRYFHFQSIKASVYGSNKFELNYADVDCALQSRTGLFKDVQVRTPPVPLGTPN